MTLPDPRYTIDQVRHDAQLTPTELWFRYFALGGMRTTFEVDAYIYGALEPTARDQDLIACALNERFNELGGDHPVPYSDDPPDQEYNSPA